MGYETLSLSSMFETKCYRQNDRSDRVIISWFWWKSEFGMVLTSQIYVLYTKHNLPIFFIIDLFLCKWWKIQALLPLRSCRRRSFSPKKMIPGKKTCHIWGMLNLSLMWELICPIWTSIPQSASGPEINATRKVTFQVALFGKDHPKSGLATYHQFPNNNATRKATLQVVFQVPEFPSGFLRYDALNIHYHCALLYSPSSIPYTMLYSPSLGQLQKWILWFCRHTTFLAYI